MTSAIHLNPFSLKRSVAAVAGAFTLSIAVSPLQAQTAPTAAPEQVVVSASRSAQARFDAPAAIDVVAVDAFQATSPLVNLSELLSAVPGVQVRERQNYAQDLQVSVRGFGTRASFGVRGVRILVDGIPATMPDGQGQAATASLSAATRIEVLRGPMAQLYGNAAGGVVQIFTKNPPVSDLTGSMSVGLGSYNQREAGATLTGGSGVMGALLDVAHFSTDGYRDHSAAERTTIMGKAVFHPSSATTVTALMNLFDQPTAQDPLGLTRAAFEQNPRQVIPQAYSFNTRKKIEQKQAGVLLEQTLTEQDTLNARAYGGTRNVFQTLAMSGAAPGSGGVVDLERDYGGVGVNWNHKTRVNNLPLSWTLGLEADQQHELRRGYVNSAGAEGAMRRNEDDNAQNTDVFGQFDWSFAEQWRFTAGVRASEVKLDIADKFNPAASNYSGNTTYRHTSPVIGLVWSAADDVNLYTNLGRGFETPTLAEVAYGPSGTGSNLGLLPSTSVQGELGAKFKRGNQSLDLALFDALSENEIVPTSSTNGRSIFQNVDGVRRRGVEAAWQARWQQWSSHLSYTWLDARFSDAFVSGTNGPVTAGNRLPGAPANSLFSDIKYQISDALSTALEMRAESHVYVNDINSDSAPGYAVVNARAGYAFKVGANKLFLYGRIDNLLDKQYAGSVIVNESNQRYFEAAPGRRLFIGLRAAL